MKSIEQPMNADSVCGLCQRRMSCTDAEKCWVCWRDLCGHCWERSGMCNHPRNEAQATLHRIVTGPKVVVTQEELYPHWKQ